MTLQANLRQSGVPVQQCAAQIGIRTVLSASTQAGAPAGNSQGTATKVPSDLIVLTGSSVPASSGYILPAGIDAAIPGQVEIGDSFNFINQGGQALSVYPNTASGKIQGGGAGAAFSIANNKQCQITYMGGDIWAADLSA